MSPTPVLLDADPGIDDALAIAYLVAEHLAGRIELTGVVCTAGNVGLDDTVRNALGWLDLAGAPSDLPVAAGAAGAIDVPHVFTPETHGPGGAGYAVLPTTTTKSVDPRAGARFWVDAARARPGELVGIVTGPSSTLAHALELEPGLPGLLGRLVVMGGTFRGNPGNTTPVSEWNVDVDPEAADRVCRAWAAAMSSGMAGAVAGRAREGISSGAIRTTSGSRDERVTPMVWCGLDLTERAVWTPERSSRLLDTADTPLTRRLVDALRFYFEFHEAMGEGYLAKVHDPLVAWIALHPEAVDCSPARLRVECAGEHTRGMTVADFRVRDGRPATAMIAADVTAPGGVAGVIRTVADRIAGLSASL